MTTKVTPSLLSAEVTAQLLPPGAVAHFAMATAPTGWLKANGQLVSRTTYAALFAAIGTAYGAGDGTTTFAVPDLRGEFLRGWDDGRAIDTGRTLGSFQDHALQFHDHDFENTGGGAANRRMLTDNDGTPGLTSNADVVIGDSGHRGNFATETRPRNIALLACIKF